MNDYSFTLPDAASTEKWGAQLGKLLRRGDVILLYGDLGMGKTTLSRGVIHGLSIGEQMVVSPTFTLVQSYETRQGLLFHYDLYRLPENMPETIHELGWDESMMEGIVLVEWPERLGNLKPKNALDVRITACPKGGRILNCSYLSEPHWQQRITSLSAIGKNNEHSNT